MGLEIVIERWQGLGGKTDFRWSVWHDGRRIQMGGAFADVEACEAEAQQFCRTAFGRAADRVTRL
ncbi:MAG: hypothetical protein BroJett029_31890 [Alphaproteobacteria bacterium]|nr:MAG: hypothetical protein BroJett029_31890 [Alphaproteobacteria bacterium]